MNIKLISEQGSYKPLEQVLRNRGVDDINDFFNMSWDDVQSPYDLDNIEEAANSILYHCRHSKTITVLVDCDADGMTSSAVLINHLRAAQESGLCGPHRTFEENFPEINYILHKDKTHGLDDTDVMKHLRDVVKPALLIIPDASGTDEQYQALNDLGIDIVVLDHHETDNTGGDHTIVVNNQQSANYKNKQLSGVGVVWQLCRVLDNVMPTTLANNYLDLVAVGLVADVMSLQSKETRFLITEGLKPENIKSLFLKQCAKDLAYSLGGDYNPTNVGFYIGPLFNAVLRIGTMDEKEILFRCLLDKDAQSDILSGKRGCSGELVPLVEEGLRQATNAKARQKRRQDKLTELIDAVISDEHLLENKVLLLAIDDFDEDQRALSGLICNKLQEAYQRPAILVFRNKNGTYSGSCRCPDNVEAYQDFRQQCRDSEYVNYAMGHPSAFGLGLDFEDVYNLQEYFNEKYADIDVTPTFKCDFLVDANDIELSNIIEELAPYSNVWGQGLPEPIIAVKNVNVGPGKFALLSSNKNPTLKFTLPHGVAAIKFRSSKEEFESLVLPYDENDGIQYYSTTIVGKASLNVYKDTVTPQILVADYHVDGLAYDF